MANKKQRPSRRTQSTLSVVSFLFLVLLFTFLAVVHPDLGFEFWIPLVIGVATLILGVPGTVHALRGLQSEAREVDIPILLRAVQARWVQAARQRGLHADALKIAWCDTDRPVTSSPGRLLSTASEAPEDVTRLGSYWRSLPAPRQVVIIGQPGAGKTSAMVLLGTALLDDAVAEAGPIPVAVNLSGWDPYDTDLVSWTVRQLVYEYPDLRRKNASGVRLAESLLKTDKIVPFFDGLDEAVHLPKALELIDEAMGQNQQFVLSCRADEYEDAVLQRHESLAAATVIELQPVRPEQAAWYLPSGGQLGGEERWKGVIDELSTNPSGPLGTALSTPLMVYLAQVAFKAERNADELLKFEESTAIEERLLQAYLPAFYPRETPGVRTGRQRSGGYTLRQAQRWLGFLASRLDGVDRQGIAWWRLPVMSGPAFIICYVALAGAIAGVMLGIAAGAVYGLLFAVLIAFRIPAYSNPVISTKPLQLKSTAAATVCGVLCGIVAYQSSGQVMASLVVGIATIMVVNSAIEAYQRHGVDELPRTPVQVLREDLKHSLRLSLSSGIAVFAGAVYMDGVLTGVVFGLVCAFAAGQAGYLDVGFLRGAVPGGLAYGMVGALSGSMLLDPWNAVLLAVSVMSTIIALNVWYRSIIARVWLSTGRRLPFLVLGFLEDAADRGVLRRSGAVYRFRHLRIQDHLASTYRGTIAEEPNR